MKLLFFLLVFMLTWLLAITQESKNERFFVGTFTEDRSESIYLCDFNSKTGDISVIKTYKGIDNPSFLKVSNDKRFLYVVSRATEKIESSGGFVIAYQIEEKGGLKFLNKQISNGAGPCHVDVSPDGKFVAIATYVGGTTSLYPVNKDGSLGPYTTVIKNKDYESDKEIIPHAHSIKFSKINNRVYSADLGTDKLNIYKLENKKLICSDQGFVKLAKGAGPRHFEFYPGENYIYVINELNSTISVLENRDSEWIEIQNTSTLPKGFIGKNYCADIHISKDGKFLYGSNRGHNSIAVFSVDPVSKKINLECTVSVEGDWPRNFALSPDGNFMLVANQKSGNISIYKINKENGIPEYIGKQFKLPSPVCIEFI